MKHKNGMQRLYVGDVGEPPAPKLSEPIPPDVDLESLSTRELFALAVMAGIDVRDIIGVYDCLQHVNMVKWGMSPKYNIAEDVTYCRNCWTYFRVKRK